MVKEIATILSLYLLHQHFLLAAPNSIQIKGSEPIRHNSEYTYALDNMIDSQLDTAWCTRAHRTSRAWIEITSTKPKTWNGFGLVNGYARSSQTFNNNSRVKNIDVYADGKFVQKIAVLDNEEPQWLTFMTLKAKSLKLVIKDVYRGKIDDLCISEIIVDEEIIDSWNALSQISKRTESHRLNLADSNQLFQPLLKHVHENLKTEEDFLQSLALYTSGKSEIELRALLFLLYAENQEWPVPSLKDT